jgi:hypothetical protein
MIESTDLIDGVVAYNRKIFLVNGIIEVDSSSILCDIFSEASGLLSR